MRSSHESYEENLPVMEYSSDDIRSRYSSDAVHESLRQSKEIWRAYLSRVSHRADDLIFDNDTEETQNLAHRTKNSHKPITESSSISKKIYQGCKSQLNFLSKRIQTITASSNEGSKSKI
jgi:hypothetical protein